MVIAIPNFFRRKFNAMQNIVMDGKPHVEDSSVKGVIVHFYE